MAIRTFQGIDIFKDSLGIETWICLRRIKVIALIVVILFGSFLVSKVSDPEEIVPVLPPWDIEAVSDPPIGTLTWPSVSLYLVWRSDPKAGHIYSRSWNGMGF